MKLIDIDTKAIRSQLMAQRKIENPVSPRMDGYYDGVMDALLEIEKIVNA